MEMILPVQTAERTIMKGMKMKEIVNRLVILGIAVAVLMAYNMTLSMRTKDEEIAKLTAQLQAAKENNAAVATAESTSSGYKDGTYTGSSMGYSDLITVDLMVSGGEISDIKIVSAPGEDSAYLSMAEALIPKMMEAQTTSVDAVSGATMSSVGLINAASTALNQALPSE